MNYNNTKNKHLWSTNRSGTRFVCYRQDGDRKRPNPPPNKVAKTCPLLQNCVFIPYKALLTPAFINMRVECGPSCNDLNYTYTAPVGVMHCAIVYVHTCLCNWWFRCGGGRAAWTQYIAYRMYQEYLRNPQKSNPSKNPSVRCSINPSRNLRTP